MKRASFCHGSHRIPGVLNGSQYIATSLLFLASSMQVGSLSALSGARSAVLVLDLARLGNTPEDIRLSIIRFYIPGCACVLGVYM